ncbi:hypothetical protein ACFWDZ_15280, partial [Micromonospora aurantiaca]
MQFRALCGLHAYVAAPAPNRQVREHARTLQARLKDRLNEYQLHRRRFLDDPAAALAAAAEQHSV